MGPSTCQEHSGNKRGKQNTRPSSPGVQSLGERLAREEAPHPHGPRQHRRGAQWGACVCSCPQRGGQSGGRRRPGCCTDYSTRRVSGRCQFFRSDSNKHLGIRWVLGQSSGGSARARAAGTNTRVWLPRASGAQKALRKRSRGRAGSGPGKVSTEPGRGHCGEGERQRDGWV